MAVETDELTCRVLRPPALNDAIEQLVAAHPDFKLRVYIRPSGTEDVLRVHLETAEESQLQTVKPVIDELVLGNPAINP